MGGSGLDFNLTPNEDEMMILELLESSRSTDGFRAALRTFLRTGEASDQLRFPVGVPLVKVERTLTKLLEEHSDLEIDAARIDANSGCEYFRGELVFTTATREEHRVRFHWDCKWRAEQEGWRDYFGFPDQSRAAREFGHDCFRSWEAKELPAGSV